MLIFFTILLFKNFFIILKTNALNKVSILLRMNLHIIKVGAKFYTRIVGDTTQRTENLYLKNTEYATNWQGDTSLINYV